MTGDGIKNGDIVIVDADAKPKNGDVIVARIDDECTIKRFFKYGEAVVLKPSSPAYPEIEVTAKNHFIYHGVVEGVLWKGIRKQ